MSVRHLSPEAFDNALPFSFRYNNGNRTASVTWEHGVLASLASLPLPPLPFHIPSAIPPLAPSIHSTFVELSDGACACVFKKISGSLPKLTHVKSIGTAAGLDVFIRVCF
jgi:hypothetical protein